MFDTRNTRLDSTPDGRDWIAYRDRKKSAKDNSKPGDFIGKPTPEEWAAHCKKQIEKMHRYFAKLQERERLERQAAIDRLNRS